MDGLSRVISQDFKGEGCWAGPRDGNEYIKNLGIIQGRDKTHMFAEENYILSCGELGRLKQERDSIPSMFEKDHHDSI